MNDMSIFSCNITYKKIKGDSEKSTYNNLVAHGFIDESYEILNDDFYKANRELNLLASDKLGKDVNLYQVKNNVAIPNTEVFKEIDLVNINKTEKNQVINQLKNEIIPADTGLLQFTRKPSNSELRSIFIGEQLSNYLSKESDSSSDSLYYRVTGRNFNEIWSSNEFTDDEKRRLLLHTIQKKLSDTNTFNGRLFRKINDRFGNLGVQLVNSDFIIYAQNGKINLDINKFYDYLKRENIENLNKYLDLGLAEELIHIVTSYITDANDIKNVLLEQIKNNDNFISMLNQKYRNENLSKNPNLIYNEYIRMLVQQEFLGTTTEQVKYTREGIINQIIAKVWEFLKSVATLPKTKEVIQKHIDFIKSDIEFEKQDSNIITPIDTSPDNQEGIDFVFEQNPELANIGTKEQYAEYIKTIFPESKLQNIVYHGTRKNSVNTNNYFKKLEGNKKDFGIYFADYSNHYVIKNEDNSYTQSIPIIVNIKNPKLINNEIEEGLSGAVLIDNNSFSVKKYYNITNQDGILEFGSYGNKNERISNEEFFNNLDKKNEEDYKIINNIFNNNIPSSMSKIIEKLNKKNNLNNLRVKEGLVFDPEQIYILGNKKDQEMFSNFVKNQFLPIEESNFDINIPCVTKK